MIRKPNQHPRAGMLITAALGCSLSLVVTGCGGGGSDGNHGGGLTPDVASLSTDADKDASGAVTLCGGKDGGVQTLLMNSFNEANPGIVANYVELGADTDAARTAAIQRLEGGADDCDVYMMDVTWTPEWASQGWIFDQSDLISSIGTDDVLPSVLESATYDGRSWGSPFYTNAGLMFYRTDRVSAPTTWRQLYADAASSPDNKLFAQFKPYEGLTVNFLEMLYSAGGGVIDDQGNVTIDSDETRAVLELMREGLSNGAVDRASLTYDETPARLAFDSGLGGFQRNWPNAWASAQQAPIAANVGVAPLPAFDEGDTPAATLGGWNFAVPLTTKNEGAVVALLKYTITEDFQKKMFLEKAQAPVRGDVYSDPDVTAAMPFANALKESLMNGKPRPKSPAYALVSRAIYENVYAVLNSGADIDETVTKMASEIESAQETF